MHFLLSKKFAIPASGEKFILKNISTEKESEEADEFHDSQKCLRQSSSKKFSKKNFMDFVCFSNLSVRFFASLKNSKNMDLIFCKLKKDQKTWI